jgi:hypothetical protein|tara:strand:- start:1997 stop:2404 length:408 start_codon:yes stop_codon:yes gene_type:complete
MSTSSVTVLTNQALLSYSGTNIKADGYYGQTDGVHTVAATVSNFQGRIYLEGSLATEPTDTDWFPIYLTSGNTYKQYPVTAVPSGANALGDTTTEAWTFRANLLWIRARVDRTHLSAANYVIADHGTVDKILLNL